MCAETEHPSVLEACRAMQAIGHSFAVLGVDAGGRVAVDDVREAIAADG